ncbi:ABC transporter permease [Paracoccus sanguinis]|uniref:ABC-2 type transport system permease protein n=1 Tax=Paracoccus sanguinis TaxID=1545044 RepID=A0A1H2U355_9RHOB|nr:ABC transporter permease [Paracoccus sanguinis]SDW50643.1 ABC-2 type transport system permease protein [Paracoccus sanguinis]
MLRGIAFVARRELTLIARHPALALLTTILPLVLLALLAAVFLQGTPTGLPVAVVDLDRTETSRSLSRLLDATPELVTRPALGLAEASDAIRRGEARATVLIPAEFERDLLDRRRPEVVLFYDNQHMTAGAVAARGARSAINGFTAGAQMGMLRAQGAAPHAVAALVQPIPIQIHPLFNPAFSYIDFLLSALVPALVQIMAAAAVTFALALDFARPSPDAPSPFPALLAAGGGVVPVMLGKLIPYALIFGTVIALADLVLFGILGVPLRGSVAILAAGTALFILSALLFGAVAFSLARDFGSAISFVAMVMAPAFGYMGIGFPRDAMPPFAQVWSSVLPGTWYLELRIDQTLRATPVELALTPLLALLAIVAVLAAGLVARMGVLGRRAAAAAAAPPGPAPVPAAAATPEGRA